MSQIGASHLFGVENELIILRQHIDHYCHAESASKYGILLCGPALSGKTLLLQTLLREHAQVAIYLDVSIIPGAKRWPTVPFYFT